ncbi:spondin-1-like [Amphibalanus amphitrite]|uniref:spondin-1-like n=1 Tax=Amphibalanus amphitrite TaxID=1232801 RepID=UPI001C901BBC|nr:spondin-1-like [Amphibalanus amphitrite]
MAPSGVSVPLVLVLLLVLVLVSAPAAAQRCNREPPDRNTAKTAGGGGFRIKFSGGVDTYTPGTIYTVKLMGWRTQYLAEKFTAFSLVAENSRTGGSSVRDAGSFQVFGFGLAKFDPNCPNMVTQTSTVPKTEAEVLWMAPRAGAGCVTFKAVVVRSRYVWYMDDEGLTKELCEEGSSHRPPRQHQQQEQSHQQQQQQAEGTCCACDEAKYELRFDGLWSRESHPKDFPRNEWLTHFSDVLVASHVPDVSMWQEGEPASDGLKQVAEYGYTRKLEQEMKVKGRALRTLTRAKGLWHPNVQGTTAVDFKVDKKRHHFSAVTMLGPSPDWILGVSGLNLCLKNCSWMEEKVIDLGLYDAGTDSGISYESPNAPEAERQPVRAITAEWPADPRAPFFGAPAAPVARITLTRTRVIPRSCDHQPDVGRHTSGADDLPRDDRPECMVTPWSDWSECSVTCGEGLSMRTREYKLPAKAQMMNCKQQLVEKVLCDAPLTCDGRPRPVSDHSGLGELSGLCAMSSWSAWSPCSVTCGQGFRMRRRNYLDRMGRKKCFHDTEEKEKCMAVQAECPETEEEEVDSACPVTDWSFWSPCSVTCGSGQRVRARLLLLPEREQAQCQHVRLMDKGPCEAARRSCTLDMMEAKRVCMLPREMGPCRGNFERWYFEPMKGMCVRFVYGGCRGNQNNFETFEDCQTSCSVVAGGGGGSPAAHNLVSTAPEPVDCMVTPWLPWEPCDRTCGRRGSGRQRRVRRIKVHPRNGGRRCPRRMERYRRCRNLPPCI